jgi:hypothetical protein
MGGLAAASKRCPRASTMNSLVVEVFQISKKLVANIMAILFSTPANVENIDALEAKFSIKIDDSYREFLTKYNGIFIDGEDYADIEFNKVKNGFISFQSLYGLNSSNRNFDIFKINDKLLSQIAALKCPLIIGDDPGGNFYVMGLSSGGCNVFYWDRTFLHSSSNDESDIVARENEWPYYLVAKTFGDFWDILYVFLSEMNFVKQENWPDS